MQFISHSVEQTQEFGKSIGELLQKGDDILLVGNLGSGKTCLTQGIAWGLGVVEYALSPSFVLMREYHGRLWLYHIDLYRLDTVEEIVDLTLDEYFYGDGVCIVEWADKGIEVLPEQHLLIHIDYLSTTERSFKLEATGERYLYLLELLKGTVK